MLPTRLESLWVLKSILSTYCSCSSGDKPSPSCSRVAYPSMAFIGVLNSWDTLDTKSVCSTSVAFSSFTIRLNLSYMFAISGELFFSSRETEKSPSATLFMASPSLLMGSKNTLPINWVRPPPTMRPIRHSSRKRGGSYPSPNIQCSRSEKTDASATVISSSAITSKVSRTRRLRFCLHFFMPLPPCSPRPAW